MQRLKYNLTRHRAEILNTGLINVLKFLWDLELSNNILNCIHIPYNNNNMYYKYIMHSPVMYQVLLII